MSIQYTRASTEPELQQILKLQTTNLRDSLSSSEWRQEGFVSAVHTLALLREMNDVCAHILAKEGEKVIGYTLCMHPCFSETIPLLRSLFGKVSDLVEPSHRFMIMGQVCVDKSFRKKGIFRGLYEAMRSALQGKYDSIITEVDNDNQRSLQAHKAIGFKTLEIYVSGNRTWHLIQLPIINDQLITK